MDSCPTHGNNCCSQSSHPLVIAIFIKKESLCFLRQYSTHSLPMTARAGSQLWVATASFLTPAPAQHPHLHPQSWQKQHQPYISVTHGPNHKHVNGSEKGKGQKWEAFVSLVVCVWGGADVWVCVRARVCGFAVKVACSITRPWFSSLSGNSQPWWGQQRASGGERECREGERRRQITE